MNTKTIVAVLAALIMLVAAMIVLAPSVVAEDTSDPWEDDDPSNWSEEEWDQWAEDLEKEYTEDHEDWEDEDWDDWEEEDWDLPEDYGDYDGRALYITQDPHAVFINSMQENDDEALWFDFNVFADSELSVGVYYGGYGSEGEQKAGMELKFLGLVEYIDLDDDDTFDPESDDIVSTYPLSSSFYESDLMRGVNDFQNHGLDEDRKDYLDVFWEYDYADGYNEGFLVGWDWGYEEGEEDFRAGEEYDTDIWTQLSEDELLTLITKLSGLDVENDTFLEEYADYYGDYSDYMDWSEEDWDNWEEEIFTDESYAWYWEGLFTGVIAGFEMGYEKGYSTAKDMGTTRTGDGKGSDARAPPPKDDWGEHPDYHDETGYWEDYGYGGHDPWGYALRYKPIKLEKVTNDDDTYSIVLNITDTEDIFSIRCKVSNDFTEIENGYLSPASVKIDIMINDYPYDSEKSQIALLMDTGSTSMKGPVDMKRHGESWDEKQKLAKDEEELRIDSQDFTGFFSWVKYAICDGSKETVRVSEYYSIYGSQWDERGRMSDQYKGVIFSYPRAKSIYHDPKLGFIQVGDIDVYEDIGRGAAHILQGNIWVFGITVIVVGALVAVSLVVKQRSLASEKKEKKRKK